MGKNSLQVVDKLDFEEIKRHHRDLIIYYGTNDHWCPLDYIIVI